MRFSITLIAGNFRTGNKAYRIIAIVIAALFSLSFSTSAKVYTANLEGNYNDPGIWVPSNPGNIITETDTVYINNNVKLSSDVVLKGVLMVRRTGSLTSAKHLVILPEGKFLNFGAVYIQGCNNGGLLFNNHALNIAHDLINSGQIVNHNSIVAGNITDNTGLITGDGGSLTSNKKIVNSQTGALKGNIDLCTNNFMNVDGASIDSTRLTFCGQRIFKNIYLSADIRKDNIVLILNNSDGKEYKKYEVERSIDGIHYDVIATVKPQKNEEVAVPFRYEDGEVMEGNSIFYRLKVTNDDNIESIIPPVGVGNALATNVDEQKF